MASQLLKARRVFLWRCLALLLLAGTLGYVTGHTLLALLTAVTAIALWNGWQLWRLTRNLSGNRLSQPNDASGLWPEIFDTLYRIRRRSHQSRRRVADAMREFRSATGAMPDGALVINKKSQMVWLNPAASKMLGLRLPQDANSAVTNLLRSGEFREWLEGAPASERLEMPSPTQSSMRLSLQLIDYGEDQRLILVRDVTQLHRLEQVRRDFVANVSHELRTPLTVIAGYVEALEDDAPQEQRAILAEVGKQANRMRQIVEDLLAISRLDAGLSPGQIGDEVNVPAMLEQIEADAVSLSGGRHDIQFHAPAPLYLLGNRKDIQSAISNLVVNAVHYTPCGGSVDVRWEPTEEGGARLSVSDTGCGIPAQHINRLTERFYRVSADRSRESGGTGLGLSIVKNVVEQHDGLLSIESELGEGSRFTCEFPSKRVTASPTSSAEQDKKAEKSAS